MVTPLQQACTSPQSLPIARLLLARGASPHFAVPGLCITPLHAAAGADAQHTAALLLAAGADPVRQDGIGRTPLHYAALTGSAPLLRRLLRALLHRVVAVALACDKAGWLMSEELPTVAALVAAFNLLARDVAAGVPLHALLTSLSSSGPGGGRPAPLGGSGGGPSAFTATPRSLAAAAGAPSLPKVVRLPPESFKSVVAGAFQTFVNMQDLSGYSAAMLAAEHGREEAVKVLLSAGADGLVRNKLSHSAAEVRGASPPPPPPTPHAARNAKPHALPRPTRTPPAGGGLVRAQGCGSHARVEPRAAAAWHVAARVRWRRRLGSCTHGQRRVDGRGGRRWRRRRRSVARDQTSV
jgi:hypothetical protein